MRGLANVDSSHQRTDGDIVRANALTFFNVVLACLILALFAVGEFRDGLFVGLVVAANVVVGTFQEVRAIRTLREMVALTAPRAVVVRDGSEIDVLASEVVQGDLVKLKVGDQVVADGHVVADSAEVDESLLTGESDSIQKRPGDELLSGSFCTAGSCYYTAEKVGLDAYALKLAADARTLVRRATPLQLRFRRILKVLLIATGVLAALLMISYNVEDRGFANSIRATTATVTTVVPEGLLLGMTVAFAVGAVRVSRAGGLVQDIQAVEAMNYIDIVCLDKTGTITANKLSVEETFFVEGAEGARPWVAAFANAVRGESKTATAIADALAGASNGATTDGGVPFNSERRWSAQRLKGPDGTTRVILMGAPETLLPYALAGTEIQHRYREATARGLRGVLFAEADRLPEPGVALGNLRPLALITLGDELRPEVAKAFSTMASLGVEPKLISGDNPETVASLLKQLGIEIKGGIVSGSEIEHLEEPAFGDAAEANSVFGRVAPALKARIVESLTKRGHFVAMVGDGANDVQALRKADVAVAMESGTSTSRAVAGIILMNDSFEAFVRGTREAQSVLGNSARLAKLFIAKSFYAYLLIIATSMLGLDFPFLPRHGSLTALFTLGIPAIFISISVPPPGSGKDFTRSVLAFAIPASLSLASAAIIVHLLTEGLLQRDIAEARTLVSVTIAITAAVFMVEVLGFEGASFRSLTRPVLTSVLGILLVAGFLATLYTDWLRDFFEFTPMTVGGWAIVIPAVLGALAGQFLITRYWPQILDFLSAKPRNEIARGRAV